MPTHDCILGITQSGKSEFSFLRYHDSDIRLSIFFNAKNERKPRILSDATVTSVKEFDKVIEQILKQKLKGVKICFDPEMEPSKGKIQLSMVASVILKIGRAIHRRRKTPLYWCHIFIDEYHRFSNKRAPSETIDLLLTEGLGLGIIVTVISQRPAMVSHTTLSECEEQYYFYFDTYDQPYFKKYKLDLESSQEWLERPYHFLMKDRHGLTRVRPITPLDI